MSPRRTSVEGSDTMSPASNDQKRKGDDGAPQPRAKRNRYISIAWYGSTAACGHTSRNTH
jgi:hypothetical protein